MKLLYFLLTTPSSPNLSRIRPFDVLGECLSNQRSGAAIAAWRVDKGRGPSCCSGRCQSFCGRSLWGTAQAAASQRRCSTRSVHPELWWSHGRCLDLLKVMVFIGHYWSMNPPWLIWLGNLQGLFLIFWGPLKQIQGRGDLLSTILALTRLASLCRSGPEQ